MSKREVVPCPRKRSEFLEVRVKGIKGEPENAGVITPDPASCESLPRAKPRTVRESF